MYSVIQQQVKSTDLTFNSKKQKKTLSFTASVQMLRTATWCWCARNVKCGDCFTARKNSNQNIVDFIAQTWWIFFYLWCFSSEYWSSTSAQWGNVRSLNCFDLIEKLYFSAGYEPICFYCTGQVKQEQSQATVFGPALCYYPQCVHCITKPKVSRK